LSTVRALHLLEETWASLVFPINNIPLVYFNGHTIKRDHLCELRYTHNGRNENLGREDGDLVTPLPFLPSLLVHLLSHRLCMSLPLFPLFLAVLEKGAKRSDLPDFDFKPISLSFFF